MHDSRCTLVAKYQDVGYLAQFLVETNTVQSLFQSGCNLLTTRSPHRFHIALSAADQETSLSDLSSMALAP